MKIGANDIRVGNILEIDKKLWVVLKTQHTQPGKGGAYMQVEMKDIKAGTKNNTRFRSSETLTKASIESKDFQYLYESGDNFEAMDKTTFEQITLSKELVGERAPFLEDGMDVTVEFYGEMPVAAFLPSLLTVEIAECEPSIKNQTASSSYKPATLVNGARITVPPFVGVGDKVVIKSESLEYVERA
jgi:elongation factor P